MGRECSSILVLVRLQSKMRQRMRMNRDISCKVLYPGGDIIAGKYVCMPFISFLLCRFLLEAGNDGVEVL